MGGRASKCHIIVIRWNNKGTRKAFGKLSQCDAYRDNLKTVYGLLKIQEKD
ncbi:hypothetical protein EUBDOL_00212 [Amedibacillus dolichus DSM 3991]|uniref:Uncharacterized protein n=1 Tax=Amedibacillus dolichus DSM 3991 TaxID=428127 RepID=A8R879_9FIRM|nr:hypothetical protein EUBDOL_00212 [Amedibacillus dolichus DSM 3991]